MPGIPSKTSDGKKAFYLKWYIAASLSIISWATAFPGVKYCLRFYSPVSLMLFRFAAASAILSVYLIAKKIMVRREDLPTFIACGLIGIFIYMYLFNTGTSMVSSGVSSFIIASAPVFTMIFSFFMLKEKVNISHIAGLLVSFAGLITIALSQVSLIQFNLGVVILIAAANCTSLMYIFQRKLAARYSAVVITAYTMIIGTVPMLIFTGILFTEVKTAPLSANLVIIYLAVFPAVMGYALWAHAIKTAPKVAHATSFLYLTPFVASIIAFIWLGESLSFLDMAGGVIIILGLLVTNFRFRRA